MHDVAILGFARTPFAAQNGALRELAPEKLGTAALTAAAERSGAPSASLGRVVLGSVEGTQAAIDAMAKAYPLNARPSKVTVVESRPGATIVRLEDIHYFLDSHHVGTFEGVLKFAKVRGRVLIAERGPGVADFLLEWSAERI